MNWQLLKISLALLLVSISLLLLIGEIQNWFLVINTFVIVLFVGLGIIIWVQHVVNKCKEK
ncbi:hypothetical protein [Lapidilactobacillus gannanensis]|uniref:Uncharacterized protein n=1 Tax=Lapidilactobacillus gannanensis TaxID=2486002 RepID=A0ABW4BMG4_9LACO|nr:hypothetical protein [Lapidilactobacillus gannanensis]